jgi:hypothetical protein
MTRMTRHLVSINRLGALHVLSLFLLVSGPRMI